VVALNLVERRGFAVDVGYSNTLVVKLGEILSCELIEHGMVFGDTPCQYDGSPRALCVRGTEDSELWWGRVSLACIHN